MTFEADTIVTGATGLVGRWLVPELTRQHRKVLVLIRDARSREAAYKDWVQNNGGNPALVEAHELDLSVEDLGLTGINADKVRDVFHLVANYQFGLTRDDARATNVLGSLRLLNWVRHITGFRRFVFITGYLAARHADDILQSPAENHQRQIDRHYRMHGAYEASKVEENLLMRKQAESYGVPLTIVNPSTVIGDSQTGRTTQFLGLSDVVRDLYKGDMPAQVGSEDAFVPVIPVDYLAAFMARVPDHPEAAGESYWILDQRTPNMPELLARIGDILGVVTPSMRLPVWLVKTLPKTLTGVEQEALSFLVNHRYSTENTERLAHKMGLEMPDFNQSLERWVGYLVSKNFCSASNQADGQFSTCAGARTYSTGDLDTAKLVFLHGMPFDSEIWGEVDSLPNVVTSRVDQPGHGRSGGLLPQSLPWMEHLLTNNNQRPLLVGHSLGCEYALRYAHAHPDRVCGVVLVAPFFLQKKAGFIIRTPWVVSGLIKLMGAKKFTALAAGLRPLANSALTSATASFMRPGKQRRFAMELARISRRSTRIELQELLAELQVPVTLVVGDQDPLVESHKPHSVTEISRAGHCPQFGHADTLKQIILKDLLAPTLDVD